MKRTILLLISITLLAPFSSKAESEDCEYARSDAESTAYDLERRAKILKYCASDEGFDDLEYRANKLKRCASYSDFSDDCYSEFKKVKFAQWDAEVCDFEYIKVKSAFSDYESAVSNVSYECD